MAIMPLKTNNMAINASVTKKSTSKYPKLMTSKDDGYVYLFIKDCLAVPLNNPDYNRVLDIEDVIDWNMDNFVDFDGSITLTN
jgi:hypothetical protein